VGALPGGGELYFPGGVYTLGSTLVIENCNNIILSGEGGLSQFHPAIVGIDSIRVGDNSGRVELRHLNVFSRSDQTAIVWEAPRGGIFFCHINPLETFPERMVGIRIDQPANLVGPSAVDIQHTRVDLNKTDAALECVGIDIDGFSTNVNVINSSVAGFTGTGVRIGHTAGSYTQNIVIKECDIESMGAREGCIPEAFDSHPNYSETCDEEDPNGVGFWPPATKENIAIDVQGQCDHLIVKHNYFEGIEGTGARFLEVGTVGQVRSFTLAENYFLTSNPLPESFVGIVLNKVVNPNIYANYGGPAGAISYSIDDTNTKMGLVGQLDTPVRYIYDLMDKEQAGVQLPAVLNEYVDVSGARSYTPVNNSLAGLATLEIVYAPGWGQGENISFRLKQTSGLVVEESEKMDSLNNAWTNVRTVRHLFYAGYNDLGKLQAKTSNLGEGASGWKILSARLIMHTN